MEKLRLKSCSEQNRGIGLVNGDLPTLESLRSPTPPYPGFTPAHRTFSHTSKRNTETSFPHPPPPPCSAWLIQRAGCPNQPPLPGCNPGEGAPSPGGVLHPSPPHNHRSLGPFGAPGWGGQPGRQRQPFSAVLTAAEPTQWRNYASASATDTQQPWSTLPLPKHASWPLGCIN